jgi:hypothetical protein
MYMTFCMRHIIHFSQTAVFQLPVYCCPVRNYLTNMEGSSWVQVTLTVCKLYAFHYEPLAN